VTEQAVATRKKIIVYLLRNTRHEVPHYAVFFQAPITSSFIGSCQSHFPEHPAFDLHLCFLYEVSNFTPDQTTNNVTVLCILIFTLLGRKWKDQTFLSQ